MNIDPPSHSPELLHVDRALLPGPRHDLLGADAGAHPPRILLLYGSLPPPAYSRKRALEPARILGRRGAEPRLSHPHGVPQLDGLDRARPKVQELRAPSASSAGAVWVSPWGPGSFAGVF